MPPKDARCPYCYKALSSAKAVRMHVSATLTCKETWEKEFRQKSASQSLPLPWKKPEQESSSFTLTLSDGPTDDELEAFADNFHVGRTPEPECEAVDEVVTRRSPGPNNIEAEVQHLRFSEPYPRAVGNPISFQKMCFERQRKEEMMNGKRPWEPFSSQEDWELARWLINNVNQRAIDKYLKLPIVSYFDV